MTSSKMTPVEIQAAERVAAVEYTLAEREQLLTGMEVQLERYRQLRSIHLPNALAPAETFDPRIGNTPLSIENVCVVGCAQRSAPRDDVDVAFASVVQLRRWLDDGVITSRRITEIYLERLCRFGPVLECVITLTPERALAQADAADAVLTQTRTQTRTQTGTQMHGEVLGCLHGIPWVAKDLLDTADIATTWGAEPYVGQLPSTDAAVVRRLDDAGAVLLAKVSMGALAYGDVWFGGTTRNPWNVEEGSSGSSAGSASAVSAGLAGFAIGSETLGSIVNPAMRCGVAGFRPTFGRVSRVGAMALAWSLDKLGPIARSVEDCALVTSVINGYDENDPGSIAAGFSYDHRRGVAGIRVGFNPRDFASNDADNDAGNDAGIGAGEVERSALAALEGLGVEMREVTLPALPYDALWTVLHAETAAVFDELTRSGADDQLIRQDEHAWPNMWRRARFIPALEYIQATRFRRQVMEVMAALFEDIDVLVAPTLTWPYQLVTNMTGHPALTLRAGFVQRPAHVAAAPLGARASAVPGAIEQRVPQGITLWGNLFDEGTLLRVGAQLETVLGCHEERPPGYA
jgi:Asp-tRNA(Asn)/Glu-tRNA(Gln) amidotransferase A subunit family amidase